MNILDKTILDLLYCLFILMCYSLISGLMGLCFGDHLLLFWCRCYLE